MAKFVHACEGQLVCKQLDAAQVPKFNSPVYLANKTKVGKVDEIFGPVNDIYFTVVLDEGFQATSFNVGDELCLSDDRLLPTRMFLEVSDSSLNLNCYRFWIGLTRDCF